MSYGIYFKNKSDVVVLDSEYARLSVIASGRYAPTQESNMGSTTYFGRVVTSAEPPLVFVRPDTVGAVAGLCLMRLLGGPGAWTGFYVRAWSNNTAQPNGRYFVAAFAAQATAQWGVRILDGTSKVIFDSGTPSALFTRAFQNWTYVKSERGPTGAWSNYYQVPFDFPQNEFLLINSFGMNLLSGGVVGRSLAVWWDFPGRNLYAITQAFANPYDFHLPAVFAKPNAQ